MNTSYLKNYDSEFCGKIPLNFTNFIQPYGMLIVLDQDLKIIQVSENCSQILNTDLEHLIEKEFSDLFGGLDELQNELEILSIDGSMSLGVTYLNTNKNSIAKFYKKELYWLVELEMVDYIQSDVSFIKINQQIGKAIDLLKSSQSIEAMFDIAAKEIKRMSGFDKVMIYQFDPEWNGIVVAEAEEPGMEKYFGLRFPASDIPKQARDMYLKNPYRMIPDVNSNSVKIYPVINPVTNSFTDLSGVNIRNVVNVHIEYLKNMNVLSSISTRIIKDNKLWGLISCHHRTAKYPGVDIRSAFELMGEIISMQLAAKENEQKLEMKIKLNESKNKIVRKAAEQDIVKIIEDSPELLFGAIKSDGVAVLKDNGITMAGLTPSVNQLNQLKDWLFRRNINEVYATDSLPLDFELGKDFKEVGSGLIVLPISKKRQEYILGFRPEVVQEVEWGGNPNDAIQMESDNKTYHPRNSFSTWKETVKYFSSPWHEEEILIAKSLSKEIIDLFE